MSVSQRSASRLNLLILNFLNRYGSYESDPKWEIRESKVGGLGVFATCDIDVGELVFIDSPVLLGPRCIPDCPLICVSCFRQNNLASCNRGCGLPVCCARCQDASAHQRECKLIRQYRSETLNDISSDLFENLTPIRSLLLHRDDREVVTSLIAHNRDQHGHEVTTLKSLGFQFKEDDEKFMRFVCCVLDANAFEVTLGRESMKSSLRGLYPLGSLANHSCVPNLVHTFNHRHQMVAKAAVFIPKDTELFHSYTRLIWGTTTRLYHLYKTKHFVCKCPRCQDPSEFGTYMSSILCKSCRGIVSPLNPYKSHGKWQCQDCKKVILGREVGELTTLLGAILRDIDQKDFKFMYYFLQGKLKTVVPEYNQVTVELKYKIIWHLGHKQGYTWEELTLDLLEFKESLCKDILLLLKKLRCGQNKIRALLLYELFCCIREKRNRSKATSRNPVLGVCKGGRSQSSRDYQRHGQLH
ncbi:SET domain-containing protein SmydA-8-like isoform X1 [Rhynchophorus ferrugineus]|uniref:SET domain-containing protein SmydA-8-like isoform X1 n=1 Tax=Rhynchophorus ferrugineus TaxID=354439 RepID=UPI003FCD07D8